MLNFIISSMNNFGSLSINTKLLLYKIKMFLNTDFVEKEVKTQKRKGKKESLN